MHNIQVHTEERKSIPEKIKFSAGEPLHLLSGQYHIVTELGRGGFAHVYSVKNRGGEIFAIKILDLWSVRPDEYELLIKKFEQEYHAGRVHSSAIARSYFTGHIAGNPYIIMDYCPNGSLAKRLRDFADPGKFEILALGILHGLKDLHHEGIIHRDLKPENVLFDNEDHPRLTDFGIAGHLHSRLTTRNIVGMVHQVWGTPLYCPPEQLSHQKAYKHTAPAMDIFSFGILMYEVISGGHHPFGDHRELMEDTQKYLDRVNGSQIISLRNFRKDVPIRWIEIITKCLQPKPQNRFGSVDEIIRLISNIPSQFHEQQELQSTTASHHAILKVVEGENPGHIFYLAPALESGEKNSLLIGWADPDNKRTNDIELAEKDTRYISRQHATIFKREENWEMMDGQEDKGSGAYSRSTNGTFVNYQQITPGTKHSLKNGDIISIGSVRLKFILL